MASTNIPLKKLVNLAFRLPSLSNLSLFQCQHIFIQNQELACSTDSGHSLTLHQTCIKFRTHEYKLNMACLHRFCGCLSCIMEFSTLCLACKPRLITELRGAGFFFFISSRREASVQQLPLINWATMRDQHFTAINPSKTLTCCDKLARQVPISSRRNLK